MMRMKNPPHPGRIVRQECIEPLGLTITHAARALGVTRQVVCVSDGFHATSLTVALRRVPSETGFYVSQ